MRDIAPVEPMSANLPKPNIPDNFLWNTLNNPTVTRNLQQMTTVNRETAFAVYGSREDIFVSPFHNPQDRGVAHGYSTQALITHDTARVMGGVFDKDGRVALPSVRSDIMLLVHSHTPPIGRRATQQPVASSLIRPCGSDMALFPKVEARSLGHVSAIVASDRKTAKMLLIAATTGQDQHPEHYVSERPQKIDRILSSLARCGYSSLMLDLVDGSVPTRHESAVRDFSQLIKNSSI